MLAMLGAFLDKFVPTATTGHWDPRPEYIRQIKKFINNLPHQERPALHQQGLQENPVNQLLGWLSFEIAQKQGALKQRDDAAGQINQLKSHISLLEKEVERLTDGLSRTESKLSRSATKHSKEMETLRAHLESEIQNRDYSHTQVVNKMESDHKRDKDELMAQFRARHNKLSAEHKEMMENVTATFAAEKKKFQAEVYRLKSVILVNHKDNEAWPDEKLRMVYRELQLLIDSVTPAVANEGGLPNNGCFGSNVDPYNFIPRFGVGEAHYLFRSAIWALIREHFFSEPLGFGVAGAGTGRLELRKIYQAWSNTICGTSDEDDLTPFAKSTQANHWRSSTFQSINAAICDENGPDTRLSRSCDENLGTFQKNLVTLLQTFRGQELDYSTEEKVGQITRRAFDIGMQFGLSPAKLDLYCPNVGQTVEISEQIHDCIDGDLNRGMSGLAELVVTPGLQMTGDGREDLTSVRTIVPCEIYMQNKAES